MVWTNLSFLCPRMLCAKFGWNWPHGSGVDDFKIHNPLLLSPLGKRRKPFEQTLNSFTSECLVLPSMAEIGPVVLEKNILKWWQCFFLSGFISLWSTNLNFLRRTMLSAKLGLNEPRVHTEVRNVKGLQKINDGQTTGDQKAFS